MKKILLIEDDHDLAKIMQKRLSQNGFEVLWAEDAYFATQTAHKEKPDLIILDLMIPGGGGISFLKNLRLSMNVQNIPVVVLTAMKNDERKKLVEDVGIQAYLEKPQDLDKLVDVIKSLLKIPES